MSRLLLLCAVALFAAVTAAHLKKKNPDIGLAFSTAVIVLLLFAALENLYPITDKLADYKLADALFLSVPLKILGLSLLTKLTCSVCEDAGEKGVSAAVSTLSKAASILIALPLFDKLLAEISAVLAL